MKEPIFTATPIHTADQMTLWIASAVAAIVFYGMVRALKGKIPLDRNRSMVLGMFLFFVFLISVSTVFFSFWSMKKTGPVRIYADSIETPFGKAAFEDILNAKIEDYRKPSLVNPGQSRGKKIRSLLIEERNKKAHYLSSENYDIEKIMAELKQAVANWKKE